MGGKGGDGGSYYAQPPDTSGYGTLDEATKTLANTAPVDLSGYQQSINTQRAAADATAPQAQSTPPSSTAPNTGAGSALGSSVLAPPGYWSNPGPQPPPVNKSNSIKTTQT